jgi:hypothetical protein
MSNFWENIVRYPKFFISSVIGLVIVITSPIRKLNKNMTGRFIFILSSTLILFALVQIFILMLEIEF